jgi:glycine betaine/proline transport system permease protein
VSHLSIGDAAAGLVDWLTEKAPWLFDGVSTLMSVLVNNTTALLMAPPPWFWMLVFGVVAALVRSFWFAVYAVVAFWLMEYMRLWDATMESLSLVVLATLMAVMIGVPLGILAARWKVVQIIVRPVLDVMQTTPVFVYLIPGVFFFGVGVVPGLVATTIFAIPPGVRLTELGIRQVDPEIVEAARAFGATPRQVLREVQLPLAMSSIMAGINQVIMLALSMVVVAGLTGAQGLGAVVVQAVTQLDLSAGFEGGLAVVLLAIFLDRVTSALAEPRKRPCMGRVTIRSPRQPAAGTATTAYPKPVQPTPVLKEQPLEEAGRDLRYGDA